MAPMLGIMASQIAGHLKPTVTGGTLTSDATYYYRTFTASGTLEITGGSLDAAVIVIAGGAGGGAGVMVNGNGGGGGGAGGLFYSSSGIYTTNQTITIGAGGVVVQSTSRTTGVTINKITGQITLASAAGTTSATTFTVTNSTVATTDVIILNQHTGTDLYDLMVTKTVLGSFDITFRTTGGTTTEQPIFNFTVIKGVDS